MTARVYVNFLEGISDEHFSGILGMIIFQLTTEEFPRQDRWRPDRPGGTDLGGKIWFRGHPQKDRKTSKNHDISVGFFNRTPTIYKGITHLYYIILYIVYTTIYPLYFFWVSIKCVLMILMFRMGIPVSNKGYIGSMKNGRTWLLCSPTFHGKVSLHMRYPLVI